jgi:hypothetical protein
MLLLEIRGKTISFASYLKKLRNRDLEIFKKKLLPLKKMLLKTQLKIWKQKSMNWNLLEMKKGKVC